MEVSSRAKSNIQSNLRLWNLKKICETKTLRQLTVLQLCFTGTMFIKKHLDVHIKEKKPIPDLLHGFK